MPNFTANGGAEGKETEGVGHHLLSNTLISILVQWLGEIYLLTGGFIYIYIYVFLSIKTAG